MEWCDILYLIDNTLGLFVFSFILQWDQIKLKYWAWTGLTQPVNRTRSLASPLAQGHQRWSVGGSGADSWLQTTKPWVLQSSESLYLKEKIWISWETTTPSIEIQNKDVNERYCPSRQININENVTTSHLTFVPTPADHDNDLICRARNPKLDHGEIEDKRELTVYCKWYSKYYIIWRNKLISTNKFLGISQEFSSCIQPLIVRFYFTFAFYSVKPEVSLDFCPNLNTENIKVGDDVYFECSILARPAPYRIFFTHNVSTHPSAGYNIISHTTAISMVRKKIHHNVSAHGKWKVISDEIGWLSRPQQQVREMGNCHARRQSAAASRAPRILLAVRGRVTRLYPFSHTPGRSIHMEASAPLLFNMSGLP